MIRHLFTLTWNKKRKHFLVIVQLLFVYLVSSFLIFILSTSHFFGGEPEHFNTDNLVHGEMNIRNDSILIPLKQQLKSIKAISHVSLTSLCPFYRNYDYGFVYYQDKTLSAVASTVDEETYAAAGLSLMAGRWFNRNDKNSADSPIVINATLKEQLFGSGSAVGKIIRIEQRRPVKIIGVIADLNDPIQADDYVKGGYFAPDQKLNSLLIKLKSPLNDKTYNAIRSKISMYLPEHRRTVMPVDQYRSNHSKSGFMAGIVLLGISIFLIVNALLGLYSILHQNINRRKPEIGLRRAAGATAWQIYSQIVLEVMALASIALVPGIIVASQFALFDVFDAHNISSYLYAMGASVVVIYVMVIACAVYPARLASGIQPAHALHEQ